MRFSIWLMSFLVCSLGVVPLADAKNWNMKSSDQKKSSFVNEKKPNCAPFAGDSGPRVGIVGDSQFTGQFGMGCGTIDYFLSHALPSGNVVNAAQSGGKFLSGGKRDITRQKLPFTPDILIIGGGGNDLASCKGKSKCLQKTLDKLVDDTGTSGIVIETINRLSSPSTKVIIAQTSKVADFAPKRWKKTAESDEAQEYVARLNRLADNDPRIQFFDYSEILDTASKRDWLKDGFHPSMSAYFRMSDTIAAKLKGDIDDFATGNTLQDVGAVRETCSYRAIREGISDKDQFYRYDYGVGKIQFLEMKHRSDLRVKFLPEEGINDISTIQTDSFLTVNESGSMSGWLGAYSGKKAKNTRPLYTTAEYSFENGQALFEGTHNFTNREWIRKSFTKLTVYDCGSTTTQTIAEAITPQTLRDEWFQMDAIDVDGLLDVSEAKPIKLKMRLGIPDGEGPFPTVVILHGSGNMQDRDRALGNRLEQNGIAWIGVYSYDSRGLKYRAYDERLIGSNVFDQVSDAFHALKFIDEHPLLDSSKAAVTGFSLGGISSYAIASASVSTKFNVSDQKFLYGLNQYGPCLMFPTDPDPSLRVEHLWGSADASTPSKLCTKLSDHINSEGGSSVHQFIEGAAHGWFKQGPPSLDADSNFQCELVVDAGGVRLAKGKKKPKDLSDLALLTFAAKHCRKKTPVEAYTFEPAEDLSVASLVKALKG